MAGASLNGRHVDHESILGSGADLPVSLSSFRPHAEALTERLRACGCDPDQRQLLDHEGAEAMLQRILNPDRAYFSPALLLVPDVTALRLESARGETPLEYRSVGHLVLFRLESGEVGIESIENPMVKLRSAEHLGADVGVQVWTGELVLTCGPATRPLLELTLERKATGLFAYCHPSES